MCVSEEWFLVAYKKVYFRIASSYRYNTGWPDEGAEDAFLAESRRLFQGAGWELHPGRPGSGICDTVMVCFSRAAVSLHRCVSGSE